MKKIVLFMAYFGKLPSYFDVWLKAAENNTTVDFCIITDCIENGAQLPENVILKSMTFREFQDEIRKTVPYRIKIHNYGRVSQFRPAFGHVFCDVVKDYDFWGYIECDLIPGDIRAFLTDEVLNANDKCFKLGHFQLFRNTQRMNTLYMTEVKSALSARFAFWYNVIYFEEVIGMYNICLDQGISVYDEYVFSDVDYMHWYFERTNFSYPDVCCKKCLYEYKDGKLFEVYLDVDGEIAKREILYAHFQKRKMTIACADYSRYIIVPNSFLEYQELCKDTFRQFMEKAEVADGEYFANIQEELKKQKYKKLKNPDYWLYYMQRLRIKRNGGIGLSGRKAIL